VTTYRVGAEGATVFDAKGGVVTRLLDGHVVVPGTLDIAGSLAAQHAELEKKRLARYADKRVRAPEDKGA